MWSITKYQRQNWRQTSTGNHFITSDSDGLGNQIFAAKTVAEQNGIDPEYEFIRHHRVRKVPRCIDDQPETAANLGLVDHYRKEFIEVLDASKPRGSDEHFSTGPDFAQTTLP